MLPDVWAGRERLHEAATPASDVAASPPLHGAQPRPRRLIEWVPTASHVDQDEPQRRNRHRLGTQPL